MFQGVDIRERGSGSMGATNVLRTLGLKLSLMVFLLDLMKGFGAVLFARWLAYSSIGGFDWLRPIPNGALVEVSAAIAAALGHNWPVYVRFRGGKGVATSLGALAALSPPSGALAFLAGIVAIVISRYASVGSIIGASTGLLGIVVLSPWLNHPWEYMAFGFMAMALILVRHSANLQRLAKGEEPQIRLSP